jgi:uncharacterized protein (UPF0332 family)
VSLRPEDEVNSTPPGEDKPEEPTPPPEQKLVKEKKISSSRPVTVYLLVLFLAAFLLLLISFGMQQRNHQALLDLNDSMANSQDVTTLQLEKQKLEFDLQDLQEDYDQLKETEENDAKVIQALEGLRQIERASRTSYDTARELAQQFQADGLADYLPDDPLTEGATSPAEDYQTLWDQLF